MEHRTIKNIINGFEINFDQGNLDNNSAYYGDAVIRYGTHPTKFEIITEVDYKGKIEVYNNKIPEGSLIVDIQELSMLGKHILSLNYTDIEKQGIIAGIGTFILTAYFQMEIHVDAFKQNHFGMYNGETITNNIVVGKNKIGETVVADTGVYPSDMSASQQTDYIKKALDITALKNNANGVGVTLLDFYMTMNQESTVDTGLSGELNDPANNYAIGNIFASWKTAETTIKHSVKTPISSSDVVKIDTLVGSTTSVKETTYNIIKILESVNNIKTDSNIDIYTEVTETDPVTNTFTIKFHNVEFNKLTDENKKEIKNLLLKYLNNPSATIKFPDAKITLSEGSLIVTVNLNNSIGSNICFLKGSRVLVDTLGYKNIENVQAGDYINKNKVLNIVSHKLNGTIVKINKNALAPLVPFCDTFVTHAHKLYYNNNSFLAQQLINGNTVTEVEVNETVYNVLLSGFKHSKMSVNNIECETLHPLNKKAIKCYQNYVSEQIKHNNSTPLRAYSIIRQLL